MVGIKAGSAMMPGRSSSQRARWFRATNPHGNFQVILILAELSLKVLIVPSCIFCIVKDNCFSDNLRSDMVSVINLWHINSALL